MSTFDEAAVSLIAHEGERYNPSDHGRGPSKYGITLKTYQEFFPNATAEDIRSLSRERAIDFYRKHFWERFKIGLIDSQPVATKMLDLVSNVGPVAIQFLQGAAGMPAAEADGTMGPRTAIAVNGRPDNEILSGIRERGAFHYHEVVRLHPQWADCMPGWMARLRS